MGRLTKPMIVPETGEILAYTLNPGVSERSIKNKLGQYEDLEEQGMLVKLPCKVGDTVYSIECDRIEEFIVSHFDVCMKSIYAFQENIFIGEMGFSVFATKEEAKAALERMKNGKVDRR